MIFMSSPSPNVVNIGDQVKLCYKNHDSSGWSATTGIIDGIVTNVRKSGVELRVVQHFGADDTQVSEQNSALLHQTMEVAANTVFGMDDIVSFR